MIELDVVVDGDTLNFLSTNIAAQCADADVVLSNEQQLTALITSESHDYEMMLTPESPTFKSMAIYFLAIYLTYLNLVYLQHFTSTALLLSYVGGCFL